MAAVTGFDGPVTAVTVDVFPGRSALIAVTGCVTSGRLARRGVTASFVTRGTLVALPSRNMSRIWGSNVVESVCAGCGKKLPRREGRGRPATYHGPACRQRARRARLAADPARADLLALLDHAGRAVADARRAATTGEDARAALAELTAVIELAEAALPDAAAAIPSTKVEGLHEHAAKPTVMESAPPETRPVTREDVIDVDTVRVERGRDFEISGSYRVLAGDSILLGYVARDRRRRWGARTAATMLNVPGGPWRTRQDALAGLLLNGGIRTAKMWKPQS